MKTNMVAMPQSDFRLFDKNCWRLATPVYDLDFIIRNGNRGPKEGGVELA
jgi:hypothetical protein